MSAGAENQFIFKFCAWAGIYFTFQYLSSGKITEDDDILADREQLGIGLIDKRVSQMLSIEKLDSMNETFVLYYDNLDFFHLKKQKHNGRQCRKLL